MQLKLAYKLAENKFLAEAVNLTKTTIGKYAKIFLA